MILECPKDECCEATNVVDECPKDECCEATNVVDECPKGDNQEKVREYNAKPSAVSLLAGERRWSWKPASS